VSKAGLEAEKCHDQNLQGVVYLTETNTPN
jgi:hypothetical protein